MKTIFITGATGNVGLAVIKSLYKNTNHLNIVAGVRDLDLDKQKLKDYTISLVNFDFTNPLTHTTAFKNCDLLFLMRPPQISDVKKYFKPIIKSAKQSGIKHIV